MKKLLLLAMVLGLLVSGCASVKTDSTWIRKNGTLPIIKVVKFPDDFPAFLLILDRNLLS